jgi:hypothetical protein
MDPFTVVVFVGLAVVIGGLYLLGRHSERSGLGQFGLRSAREIIESREALDAEDLEQMLAAHNARRRARGQAELSVEDVELRVSLEEAQLQRERERLTGGDPDEI